MTLNITFIKNDAEMQTFQNVPIQPTETMLNAARDWSIKKYGMGIGNDAAIGCWQAMLNAAPDIK